jgi:hypothetical protein
MPLRPWTVVLLALATGCSLFDLSADRYACAADAECLEGFSCVRGACLPQICNADGCSPDTLVGLSCAEDTDCGEGGACVTDQRWGYPNGYCSRFCKTDEECGSPHARCVGGTCFRRCLDSSTCRPGYKCFGSDDSVRACAPATQNVGEQCNAEYPCIDGFSCTDHTPAPICTRECDPATGCPRGTCALTGAGYRCVFDCTGDPTLCRDPFKCQQFPNGVSGCF